MRLHHPATRPENRSREGNHPAQTATRLPSGRAPLVVNNLDEMTITVPCDSEQCRKSTLKPLSELIVSDSIACRWCGNPIDITRPYWQATLRKAMNLASKVKPKVVRE
jgi:hypothetical protein